MPEGRLSRTLAVSLPASFVGAAATFLLATVVGRLLGTTGTGVYFQVVALTTVTITLLKLGADTGLVRTLAQLVRLGESSEVCRTLRIALVPVATVAAFVAVSVYTLADEVAIRVVHEADQAAATATADLFRFIAPFLVIAAVFYVALGGARGLGSVVGYSGLLNIGLPISRLVLVSCGVVAGLGAFGAVQAWVASLPLWCALAGALLWRRVRLTRSAAASEAGANSERYVAPSGWRAFWGFSFGRWAGASVEIVLDWVDVIMVGALTDPAMAGAYAIASRVSRAGQVVDNAMRVAVGPRLSALLVTKDHVAAERLFRQASRTMVTLSLPYYVTCLVFAPSILQLFGPGFDSATVALRILCLGMIVSATTVILQSVILMGGRSHWQLLNKTTALVVAVVSNAVLIPQYGLSGAATAWLLAMLVDAALVTYQSYHLTRIRPHVNDLGAPLLLVGAGVAAIAWIATTAFGDGSHGLIAHVVALGIVYVAGAVIFIRRVRR